MSPVNVVTVINIDNNILLNLLRDFNPVSYLSVEYRNFVQINIASELMASLLDIAVKILCA